MFLFLVLGMFVLCFFSMGACSRFCLGYWLPSSLYILFLFATFMALLPLILIYSYIWSKKKQGTENVTRWSFPWKMDTQRSVGGVNYQCLVLTYHLGRVKFGTSLLGLKGKTIPKYWRRRHVFKCFFYTICIKFKFF
jgi:hypothetical protein